MYAFEPSEEQQMLIDTIKRYAENTLRPVAHEADESAQLPTKIINTGWELGVLQASIPEEYGGFGDHSALTGVLAAEEIAWGDLAGAMAVMTPGLFALPIYFAGDEEQKKAYLPKILEGGWSPYTSAWMEPSYDFDIQDLVTIATQDNGHFVLNGKKCYVPFAREAKYVLTFARYEDHTQGFIVPGNEDGMVIHERQKYLGINALPLYTISLEDVKIPKEYRLGRIQGHELSTIISSSRLALSAMAIGVARAAFEYSRDYAKDRDVFGVKVAQKQAIAFMLAEMATEIEAIRLLNWEAAWLFDQQKEEANKQAYLALTGAADMVMMVTDRAVQILGGHGYIREHPVEMWMRNGRGFANFIGLAMV